MPHRSPETSSSDIDLETVEYELRELIRHELRSLNDEIRVLRQSIDAFFEAFDHAIVNGRIQYVVDPADPPPTPVTSFALDPTAEDFQLNSVSPEKLDELRSDANADGSPAAPTDSVPHKRPSKQAHLF